MEGTIDGKMGGVPSLSTMNYDEFERAAEMKRKESVPRVSERRKVRKAAAVVVATGAIFLSGMYVGARYSNELANAGDRVKSYISGTAEAAENQKTTHNGGK